MWNAGKVPARMIEVISPAGFEHFFWGLADHIESGLPDPAVIEKLASDYGLHFAEAPWLPDIISSYNLTPPPG